MSTDHALARIAAAGFKVNNLFQRDDGRWQANLRGPEGGTDFALAGTPCAALRACAEKLGMEPPRPAIALRDGGGLL